MRNDLDLSTFEGKQMYSISHSMSSRRMSLEVIAQELDSEPSWVLRQMCLTFKGRKREDLQLYLWSQNELNRHTDQNVRSAILGQATIDELASFLETKVPRYIVIIQKTLLSDHPFLEVNNNLCAYADCYSADNSFTASKRKEVETYIDTMLKTLTPIVSIEHKYISDADITEWAKASISEYTSTGSLKERERKIVEMCYLSDELPSLSEIGKKFGISAERARQLLYHATNAIFMKNFSSLIYNLQEQRLKALMEMQDYAAKHGLPTLVNHLVEEEARVMQYSKKKLLIK
ncbi:hypothetical protein HYX01_01710 [Candidatus Woesearchaeota archaeon]|nr:hypothetical protein [Candidatus Woesearchaeota archaeon]